MYDPTWLHPRNGSLSPEQWMATEEVPKRFRSFFGHICLLQGRDGLIIFQVFNRSRSCDYPKRVGFHTTPRQKRRTSSLFLVRPSFGCKNITKRGLEPFFKPPPGWYLVAPRIHWRPGRTQQDGPQNWKGKEALGRSGKKKKQRGNMSIHVIWLYDNITSFNIQFTEVDIQIAVS